MRESEIKRILAFPPLLSGHPDRRLIADLLFEIADRATKGTSDMGAVRLSVNISSIESRALERLATARGWTKSYAVRRALVMLFEEAVCDRTS